MQSFIGDIGAVWVSATLLMLNAMLRKFNVALLKDIFFSEGGIVSLPALIPIFLSNKGNPWVAVVIPLCISPNPVLLCTPPFSFHGFLPCALSDQYGFIDEYCIALAESYEIHARWLIARVPDHSSA